MACLIKNLPGGECSMTGKSGTLYLCSNEYISTFPFTPAPETDRSSDLMIEEVTVDNSRTYYQLSDPLPIHYSENELMIRYTVIDYEKSNYQFSYRLDPTNPWIVVGDQRNINLSNLQPGAYADTTSGILENLVLKKRKSCKWSYVRRFGKHLGLSFW
jgi:hypothetical protein